MVFWKRLGDPSVCQSQVFVCYFIIIIIIMIIIIIIIYSLKSFSHQD